MAARFAKNYTEGREYKLFSARRCGAAFARDNVLRSHDGASRAFGLGFHRLLDLQRNCQTQQVRNRQGQHSQGQLQPIPQEQRTILVYQPEKSRFMKEVSHNRFLHPIERLRFFHCRPERHTRPVNPFSPFCKAFDMRLGFIETRLTIEYTFGRLAQLVAHHIDIVEVACSSHAPPSFSRRY
mgnify:CR=1 FL=1